MQPPPHISSGRNSATILGAVCATGATGARGSTKRTGSSKCETVFSKGHYDDEQLEFLFGTCMEEVLPIGPQSWGTIERMYTNRYLNEQRKKDSLRKKYNKAVATDLTIPLNIQMAKNVDKKLLEKSQAPLLDSSSLGMESRPIPVAAIENSFPLHLSKQNERKRPMRMVFLKCSCCKNVHTTGDKKSAKKEGET